MQWCTYQWIARIASVATDREMPPWNPNYHVYVGKPGPRPNGRLRPTRWNWHKTSWPCMRPVKHWIDHRSIRPWRKKSKNLSQPLLLHLHRINPNVSRILKMTWSGVIDQWIGWFVVMSALVKQKSRYELFTGASWMASRPHCSLQRGYSPHSITKM